MIHSPRGASNRSRSAGPASRARKPVTTEIIRFSNARLAKTSPVPASSARCLGKISIDVPHGRGAILNVGSTAGFHPFPGQLGYSATKAFVKSYTEGLRGELAGTGVTVALLCPGPVRTEFLQSAGMDEREFAKAFPKFMWMPSRDVARVGARMAIGATSRPDRGRFVRISRRWWMWGIRS